ncbi:MAG: peptidyl-prolyl cis-trans isomerase [Leptospirillia bacterium]
MNFPSSPARSPLSFSSRPLGGKAATALLAATFVLLAGCHQTLPSTVVAKVGPREISKESLQKAIKEMNLPSSAPASVPSDVLNRIIDSTLISQEADREGLASVPALRKKIEDDRDRILRQALIKKEVDDKVKVTDADVKDYFDKHRQEIKQPGYVKVRQLILPDQKTATRILSSLHKKKGFSRAIAKFKGGPVGKIFEGTVPPQFTKFFFGVPAGSVTGPISLKDGIHYFKVDTSEPGKLLSFDEAKAGISQFLTSRKKQDLYQKFLNSLRAKTKISINQKTLAELMGAATPTKK